jgi:outer membrane immunogenic protein
MKRISLIAVVTMLGFALNAQPAGGKVFVGGSMDFYHHLQKSKYSGGSSVDNTNYTEISLWPTAGYFLNDKMAVGASLGFGVYIDKNPGTYTDKVVTTEVGITPFFRYYLISGTGGLFADASIYAGIGSTKYDYTNTASETDNLFAFSMGIAPGAYYYITPKIALIGKFGWLGFSSNMIKYENDNKDIDNKMEFSLSPSSLSLGLNITL